jgi:hypothetical protein
LELIQKSKGGIIAALFKFYNIYNLPVSSLPPHPQGNGRRHSLTASAPPWSIYRRGQSTAEEERQRTQPGTPEARHTGSQTQQQTATAPPYNQEARKRKRTRKRDGISHTYKTINDIHRADKEGQAPFLSALSVSMDL